MLVLDEKRVNETIFTVCRENGWTKEELSARIGICSASLHNRETGKREWRVNELIRLADLAGVTIEEFTREEEPYG